jgi:hypothetical protein
MLFAARAYGGAAVGANTIVFAPSAAPAIALSHDKTSVIMAALFALLFNGAAVTSGITAPAAVFAALCWITFAALLRHRTLYTARQAGHILFEPVPLRKRTIRRTLTRVPRPALVLLAAAALLGVVLRLGGLVDGTAAETSLSTPLVPLDLDRAYGEIPSPEA